MGHAPAEIVEALATEAKPNDRNLTNPRRSYLDAAFSRYYRPWVEHDPRLVELARVLGGTPPFTGPQADLFLESICEATGDDAPSLMKTYLDMGYRPRSADDPPFARSDEYDEGALSNCIWRSPEAALLLIDDGADPNQPGVYGQPPLFYALFPPDLAPPLLDVVESLLAAGADPSAMAHSPGAPLDSLARSKEDAGPDERAALEEAILLLRAHGGKAREELLGPEPPRAPRKPLLPIE